MSDLPEPAPEEWRPLADALYAAMTEAGGGVDFRYNQATAQDAVAWLNQRGYSIKRVN